VCNVVKLFPTLAFDLGLGLLLSVEGEVIVVFGADRIPGHKGLATALNLRGAANDLATFAAFDRIGGVVGVPGPDADKGDC
jgi:hypothetical protein